MALLPGRSSCSCSPQLKYSWSRRSISSSSSPPIVSSPFLALSFDRTMDNLERFCTDTNLPNVLTFDPTFNLGQFDVTVTTYKHPLLVFRYPSEHSSEHPNLIVPVLIHQRKQFNNYYYFTSTIVGFRPQLRKLIAFGTDGELALIQACQSQFPTAVHLRCWLHFKENLT